MWDLLWRFLGVLVAGARPRIGPFVFVSRLTRGSTNNWMVGYNTCALVTLTLVGDIIFFFGAPPAASPFSSGYCSWGNRELIESTTNTRSAWGKRSQQVQAFVYRRPRRGTAGLAGIMGGVFFLWGVFVFGQWMGEGFLNHFPLYRRTDSSDSIFSFPPKSRGCTTFVFASLSGAYPSGCLFFSVVMFSRVIGILHGIGGLE